MISQNLTRMNCRVCTHLGDVCPTYINGVLVEGESMQVFKFFQVKQLLSFHNLHQGCVCVCACLCKIESLLEFHSHTVRIANRHGFVNDCVTQMHGSCSVSLNRA